MVDLLAPDKLALVAEAITENRQGVACCARRARLKGKDPAHLLLHMLGEGEHLRDTAPASEPGFAEYDR
jgi:hypothetical protein